MKFIITIALIVNCNLQLFADGTIIYQKSGTTIGIGSDVLILEDSTSKLEIKDIIHSPSFKRIKQDVPNLGISYSTFWVKFEIQNNSNEEQLLLELSQPTIDKIEFYSIASDSIIVNQEKMGEDYVFSKRKYDHPNYIFDLHIPKGSRMLYYLKIKSGEQIQLPLTLGTRESIFNGLLTKDIIFGTYCGIMIVMFLYNIFIYLVVKDRSYLYYITYIILVFFNPATIQGYTFKFLWPNSPWMAKHSVFIFASLVGVAAPLFEREFLHTAKYTPTLNKIISFFFVSYFVAFILALFNYYQVSYALIQVNAMLVSVFMLIIAYKIYKQGSRSAFIFLIAWSIFLVGVCVFVLKDYLIPYNSFTFYTFQFGSAIEVILLSFALADRINDMKKEKEESQAQALLMLRENEKIIMNQNSFLELKVKERTAQLEMSNKNLKETQSQLVNAEKMASLGQLTAGIAHEINNPINFVLSNVQPLKMDVEEILEVLTKYEELDENADINEKLKEINELKKMLGTKYLVNEINLLLKGITEGAQRTSEIVKGLKNFSRLDEAALKNANIHEGIDATLTILNNSIVTGKITIVKDYGNLPEIECYPGKLNQVFMNLLNNAIQAITAKNEGTGTNDRTIVIQTRLQDATVKISIKDSGVGISEKNKNKIFEPFFTTKPVGTGTGLGLSIVYTIIKNHQGEIQIESEEGKWTMFTITLPVTLSNKI